MLSFIAVISFLLLWCFGGPSAIKHQVLHQFYCCLLLKGGQKSSTAEYWFSAQHVLSYPESLFGIFCGSYDLRSAFPLLDVSVQKNQSS